MSKHQVKNNHTEEKDDTNDNQEEVKHYSQRELKRILHKISKLSEIEHRGIYKIITRNDLLFTHNKNGIFIGMSTIPNQVIAEIEKFVNFCVMNNVELDAHEKKLNECKYGQFYKITWNNQKNETNCGSNVDAKDGNVDVNGNGNGNRIDNDMLDYCTTYGSISDRRKDVDIEFNNLGESTNDTKFTDSNEDDRVRTKSDWSNLLHSNPTNPDNSLVNKFVNHLDDNMDNLQKKKTNMHYTNAKKKFSRKINIEKKCDQDICNILTLDEYNE